MSTDRDVTRIVRSWLEEGATALPDRVLDNVLDLVPATPQRRPMWPAWRSYPMQYLRLGLAAAAVVVAAIVGVNLMPDQGVGPGSTPAPTPTSSPSPTSRPTPVTTPIPTPHTGQLPVPSAGAAMTPGSYLIDDPFPLRVSLTVGDEWMSWSGIVSDGAGIYKYSPDPPNGMGIVVAIVDNLYADACDASKGLLDPPLGPTVDDLVEALSGQVRTRATTPTDIALDGYSGKYFEYTATAATETCSRTLSRWPTAAGAREALLDEHDKVWIVDVDGTRLVIDAFSFPNPPAADLAEIQAVVDSIQIEP